MKLSIITINFNNAEGLRQTLASVAAQTYRNIEHIIISSLMAALPMALSKSLGSML